MRFKLDENVPDAARQVLVLRGHDVHTVAEEQLAGAIDREVLDAAMAEQRVLITLDLDFADNIRTYPPGSHAGILRPPKQTFKLITACVESGVAQAATERTNGQLWVIDDKRIRIRDAESR